MAAWIDMTNKVYNKWTVVGPYEKRGITTFWMCKCVCGVERFVNGSKLRLNKSKGCGCKKLSGSKRKTKHGMYKTKEYNIWRKMKSRCLSTKSDYYDSYGGRGITVSKRWLEFKNFYEDMGVVPSGYTLDRIDVNGNYCKENCRWATVDQQSNNKRNTVYVTINNVTNTLSYWSEKLNIPRSTIRYNIKNGILSDEFIKSYKPINKCKKNTFRKNNIVVYKLYTLIKFRCKKSGREFYEPWKSDFELFLSHIGKRPSKKHSVDRIDNNKGYIPGNIRWATNNQQSRNKSNNHFLTIEDKTLCITDWAKLADVDAGSIRRRLAKGLSIKDSVFWKNKGIV